MASCFLVIWPLMGRESTVSVPGSKSAAALLKRLEGPGHRSEMTDSESEMGFCKGLR